MHIYYELINLIKQLNKAQLKIPKNTHQKANDTCGLFDGYS